MVSTTSRTLILVGRLPARNTIFRRGPRAGSPCPPAIALASLGLASLGLASLGLASLGLAAALGLAATVLAACDPSITRPAAFRMGTAHPTRSRPLPTAYVPPRGSA